MTAIEVCPVCNTVEFTMATGWVCRCTREGRNAMTDIDDDTDVLDASAVEETLIDEIMRLRADLRKSDALIAAAFGAVSDHVDSCSEGSWAKFGFQMGNEIRALTPPDAQAALQAMIDAAVKEALIEAAHLVDEKYAAGEMGNPGHHIHAKIDGTL